MVDLKDGTNSLDSLDGISLLPTRGENRIIPSPINSSQFPTTLRASGIPADFNFRDSLDDVDFAYTKAKQTLTDYITIQVNNRLDKDGKPYKYRFLINPDSLSIGRNTVDGQTMTRGGWQFGVWGEDFIRISGKGTTAGQYFARALTSQFEEFTLSYRNLLAFIMLFENNGYWFEGENKYDNGPLAPDSLRRRIKKHSDVVFTAGNFIWNGMFQSLVVVESADTPFFNTFSFNFIAWKERYRSDSPWLNSTESDLYRGHSDEVIYKLKNGASNSSFKPDISLINSLLDTTPTSLSSINNQTSGGITSGDSIALINGLYVPPLLNITKGLNK
jgi:hypothetical protein